MEYRTDLAAEAYAIFGRDAGQTTRLPGVRAREEETDGVHITRVDILDERGARALAKPVGRYVTLELCALRRHEAGSFPAAVRAIAREAAAFLRGREDVLCAGLGNEALAVDAFGAAALEHLLVTRHLKQQSPEAFSGFCSVSAIRPGVLGTSGMEALELVRAAAQLTRARQVIVLDALAAADAQRLFSTVQLTDAGIAPGSGVGNCRAAFTRRSVGAPVLALGVPTVVDARALAPGSDTALAGLIVTARDVDARVREIARAVGLGLDLALHPQLTLEQAESFLA